MSDSARCTVSFTAAGHKHVEELDGREILVGRDPSRDLVVPDDSVSRKHARISSEGERWLIADLNSKNGVVVGERKLAAGESYELHDGERVRLGTIELCFEIRGSSMPATSTITFEEDEGQQTPSLVLPVEDLQTLLQSSLGAEETQTAPVATATYRGSEESGRAKILELFQSATEGLVSCNDLDEMFGLILELAFQHLPAERGGIFLCGSGASEDDLVQRCARVGQEASEDVLLISRTIARAAIRDRQGVHMGDSLDDELAGAQSIVLHQIRSAICAPLIYKDTERGRDHVRGLIYLDTQDAQEPLQKQHLELLMILALFSAVALERQRLKQLQRYSSPAVAERIMDQGQEFQSEERQITTLFADISGFTKMAASMRPIEVTGILNEVFERLAQAVFEAEGTLDKFIGDEIMAFWGAPVHCDDHARRAVECALQMQRALEEYNADHPERRPLHMSIGINTGDAVVGDIGSSKRKDYTVIGASVNLAKRVESYAAEEGEVAVGPSTHEAIQAHYLCQPTPPIEMKNLDPLVCYKVLGRK